MNKQIAIVYWFFTLSYMALIFYFSSIKGHDLPHLPQNFDKVVYTTIFNIKINHIGIYAVLAILSYLSFKESGLRKHVLLLSIILTIFYGISDEFHQLFVPGRFASVGDVLADSIGAFSGAYVASVANVRKGVNGATLMSSIPIKGETSNKDL